MTRMKRRWSDRDHHFGPFLVARDNGRGSRISAVVLNSGSSDDDDDESGCHLRLQIRGHTLIIELPAIIKPYREKVKAKYWSAATIAEKSRDWYYEEHPREYGVSLSDGFLQVFYGRQTGDSTSTQSWSKFLPWSEFRLVCYNLYDKDGGIFYTDTRTASSQVIKQYRDKLERRYTVEDYDGVEETADVYVHEHIWRRGEGWFKWLGHLFPPKSRRCLNIEYSAEIGPEKGGWKGGVLGTTTPMEPNETLDQAFKRHCETNRLKILD